MRYKSGLEKVELEKKSFSFVTNIRIRKRNEKQVMHGGECGEGI